MLGRILRGKPEPTLVRSVAPGPLSPGPQDETRPESAAMIPLSTLVLEDALPGSVGGHEIRDGIRKAVEQ